MNNNTGWPDYDPMEAKYGKMSRDELLMEWQTLKTAIETAKANEMDMRKFIVKKAFPEAQEGTNTVELGNGYELKAKVSYNYKLADNDTVEKTLDEIAKVGNQGSFIAERLVSWKPSFLLTEYRTLQEDQTDEGKKILKLVSNMLTISEAAPGLEIKPPKDKKK